MPLQLLTESDLPLVLTWRNSPEVRRYMLTKHLISEKEHRAWFKRIRSDESAFWYIHSDQDGVLDGVIGFSEYKPEQKSAFWGFYLGEKTSSSSGLLLGFEGLEEAFNGLKLHKLNAEVTSDNGRSLSFHRKLGFEEEGHFKQHYHDGDQYLDVFRFGILAKLWERQRQTILHKLADTGHMVS
jgi:UDP-4-amino-4,6-dideoxy-N-acetyl-beta-L-altrosamine N-acetyltransferase